MTHPRPTTNAQARRNTLPYKFGPRLSHEEERELARRGQAGDDEALHRLVMANMYALMHIAKRHVHYNAVIEDLVQAGVPQLVTAARHWNPDGPTRFGTYFWRHVRSAIRKAAAIAPSGIIIPGHIVEGISVLAKEQLTGQHIETRIKNRDLLLHAERIRHSMAWSIDAIGANKMPAKRDQRFGLTEEFEARDWRETVLQKLDARSAEIVRLHFGLPPEYEELDNSQIGVRLGISRERVRQLLNEAINKLRRLSGVKEVAKAS